MLKVVLMTIGLYEIIDCGNSKAFFIMCRYGSLLRIPQVGNSYSDKDTWRNYSQNAWVQRKVEPTGLAGQPTFAK